jgi:hypothetical protein
MTTYVENYGFSKTITNNNHNTNKNEVEWFGNYNGKVANINVKTNNNGNTDSFSAKLTNQDLIDMLKIQPVPMALDKRLINDFQLNKKKSKKRKHKLRKTKRKSKFRRKFKLFYL